MSKPLNILIVEDHEDTASMLKLLLRQEGHSVKIAGGVIAAQELAAENQFDLLMCDLGLPDGNAYDLMRELKQRSAIRGVALSGYGSPEDIRDSLAAGFEAHLVKPVDFSTLMQRINAGSA